MENVIIGAIDCSFNNCGWSIWKGTTKELYCESTGIIIAEHALKEEYNNQLKLVSMTDLCKSIYMINKIKENVINTLIKQKYSTHIFAMEVQTGSKSARAATCLGMAKGILASSICEFEKVCYNDDYYIGYTPNEIKNKVSNNKKVSKDDIMNYTCENYNVIKEKLNRNTTYNINKNKYTKTAYEHIADSMIIANLAHETFIKYIIGEEKNVGHVI